MWPCGTIQQQPRLFCGSQSAATTEARSSRDVAAAQEVVDCSKTERLPPIFSRFGQRRRGCNVASVAGSSQSCLKPSNGEKGSWFRGKLQITLHA
ncbi:hypothetical protein V6N13_074974 [Hibiscus sabdariffa]